MTGQASRHRRHVVVAGGGVAAVEAVLALHALAGRSLRVTLMAPEPTLVHRPASVATPFGFGLPAPLSLNEVCERVGAERHDGALERVEPTWHAVTDDHGRTIVYDALVIAVGARPRPVVPGAVTFAGPGDAGKVERLLDAAAETARPCLAFALPAASTWSLPLYELAIMAAVELRSRGVVDARLTVVTPEARPLWAFGPQAGEAVSALLAERGIALRTGTRPLSAEPPHLAVSSGPAVPADSVVALPGLEGPAIPGLPRDHRGFVPTDAHGQVGGARNVFAAGDATSFPLKQGGLAAQQADAVAEMIAAEAGAPVRPRPFRPVLRGLLLTGGAPLYLRAELDLAGNAVSAGATVRGLGKAPIAGEVSTRALWWPPGKVAGRYLAPLLATARPPLLAAEPLADVAHTRGSDHREEDAALELALLLADEDAALGDYAQAIHALDAAAALGGGVLPREYADKRDSWLTRLRAS